jgi:hypothetical protein
MLLLIFCALVCAAEAYDCGLHFLTLSPQCDIIDNREVSSVEGRDLAKSFGLPFFESSAKSRINVEEAFYELVRVLFLDAHFCFEHIARRFMSHVTCRMSHVAGPRNPATNACRTQSLHTEAQEYGHFGPNNKEDAIYKDDALHLWPMLRVVTRARLPPSPRLQPLVSHRSTCATRAFFNLSDCQRQKPST